MSDFALTIPAATMPSPLRPLGPAAELAPITSDAPGSFPWSVLHERHPKLIRQVMQAHPYPPHILQALQALLAATHIEPLPRSAHDKQAWDVWTGDYAGRPWDAVPFLWAESYFYRRLLDAVDFFRRGPWFWVDPFEPTKSAELGGDAFRRDVAALDARAGLSADERARATLLGAVWGNQADLGFRLNAGRTESGRKQLIVDDTEGARRFLDASPGHAILIADNAGTELLADLVLIDDLLRSGAATSVELHLKPRPYYVSDATSPDLLACLRALGAAGEHARRLADRLRQDMRHGTLTLSSHAFYCEPWSFHYMPRDLAAAFGAARLVVVKGDLNYRRLVGDLHWPPTASFADSTDYFPAPVVALRILKSDVILGLAAATVSRLDGTDPSWRVDGTYALAQARLAG